MSPAQAHARIVIIDILWVIRRGSEQRIRELRELINGDDFDFLAATAGFDADALRDAFLGECDRMRRKCGKRWSVGGAL